MFGKVIVAFIMASLLFPAYAKREYIDRVVVLKSERKMQLIKNDEVIKEYTISLGGNPSGHKQREGDSRTPEGHYTIDYRNPQSKFYLSLHISYPDKADRANARQEGVRPGGDIFIHGQPNGLKNSSYSLQGVDWTDGCIAVSNTEIEEIWGLVKNGTPIEIRP